MQFFCGELLNLCGKNSNFVANYNDKTKCHHI